MELLSTPWSKGMGLEAPILNAPMGGVAGGTLASAVSAAGGLGMVGVGSVGSVALLNREASHPRESGLRFGIGLLDWALAREPDLLEAALSASPRLISVSFGDRWAWVEQVKAAGVITAAQVSNVAGALDAEEAGVEVLVARGGEGGGHGDPNVGTLPLLEGVLDAASLPVLAAGGISSPRRLAAVLAAGASGAWLGTAFTFCPESLTSDTDRYALLEAKETQTITTSVFDIAFGYDWPSKDPERVLCNELVEQWSGREQDVTNDAGARALLVAAMSAGDHSMAHVNAGQGVGMLKAVQSAADVVEWMCDGAAALLRRWHV